MAALVWGNPPDVEADRIVWVCAKERIATAWIDVDAQLRYAGFVTRCLDGIDWQRSLEGAISDGENSKPVFEWDG